MSRGEEKAKRWRPWRPRFSVRTLAIFVTLVCCYFGAWEATKRYGIPAMEKNVHDPVFIGEDGKVLDVVIQGSWYYYGSPNAPAPFVVTVQRYDGVDIVVDANGDGEPLSSTPHARRTYLWFFGYIYPREVFNCPST